MPFTVDKKKKGDKDKPIPAELSEEDQVLKEGLELAVTRLREDDTSLHKQALDHLISEIKSSTLYMPSVPKPLNILRYVELKAACESWPLMHSMELIMAVDKSIFGVTMAEVNFRNCLLLFDFKAENVKRLNELIGNAILSCEVVNQLDLVAPKATALYSARANLAAIFVEAENSNSVTIPRTQSCGAKAIWYILRSFRLLCLLVVYVVLFAGTGVSATSNFTLPESEYLALYDLYNSTNGADWDWTTRSGNPWVFSADANPCADVWQGVTCVVASTPSPNTYHIVFLQLPSMNLQGPIPSSIGNITELVVLDLGTNKLTSSIPSSIGSLPNLLQLDLDTNQLTGTLPSSITNLTNMQYLYLGNNQLTGSVCSSIGRLTNLQLLALNINQLTGYLPSAIGNLTNLHYLYMYDNYLTGSIPSSIRYLANLQYLIMGTNQLTGSLPSAIGKLTNLQYLDLDANQLDGRIPSALGNLTNLQFLIFFSNQLTGTIPSSICNLKSLQYLYLQDNHLSGTMPTSLGDLVELTEIVVEKNLLHGVIPNSLGKCSSLNLLDLSNNAFTGTVPLSVSDLKALLSISLQGNRLTGPLTGRFNKTQVGLLTIQLDDNQFTGELPSVLFEMPSLLSLSIVGSCLHGTLPGNICNATKLEALILYGLTTGASCRGKGVQSLSQPLTHTQHTFGGAFPSCLLGLPDLTTLLLSSNRLTGSISSSIVVAGNLTELDLSHNALEGTIPNSLQNRSWSMFDLSNNKFTGVLQSDMFPQGNSSLQLESDASPVVSLTNNRLSGLVPSSLRPLQSNLSVLAGNLFECKYDKSNLPQHDSDINRYECASNGFDISIYVWLGMGAAALAVVLCAYRHLLAQLLTSFIQLPDELSSRLTHLFALLEEFHSLQKAGWLCGAFCMCVLLPYYVTMSHFEGTHTYKYAYVLSAIYTSGVLSFVLDTLLLGLLVVGVYSGGQVFMRGKFVARRLTVYQVTWKRTFVWVSFVLVNITLVFGANVAFVYVVLYQRSQWQTLVQILLSLFKLGWSMAASPALVRRLRRSFNVTEDVNESYFTLQPLVALFNNIAIPCLVVAAIDTNCFSNILLPPNSETVEYSLPICNNNEFSGQVCEEVITIPTTLQFTPPFTYSYQCSASLITYYSPAFIYMSISTVFLNPLLQYVLLRLHQRLPTGSIAQRLVSKVLPRILKPPKIEESHVADFKKAPILGSVVSLVALLTQLGILLTFGAIFPPVALAMAVSITAVVVVYRYRVQQFVCAVADKQLFSYLQIMNAECEKVGTREQMQVAAKILICYCCAFYTLFLFDTLGDAVGFEASVWVLIVVPLLPVAVFGGTEVHRRYQLHFQHSQEKGLGKATGKEIVVDVELSTAVSVLQQHWEDEGTAGVPGKDAEEGKVLNFGLADG